MSEWKKKQLNMKRKKYYKTLADARKAQKVINDMSIKVFRMPKGSRMAGWYMVGTDIEYLNTY